MLGQLFQLFLGIGGKQTHTGAIGECDVAGTFNGVAERHGFRCRTQTKAQFDFGARCGVKVPAQRDQGLDDLGRGVCFDGIVDVGATQTGAQGAELTGNRLGIDDQRRAIERMRADVVFDTGNGSYRGFPDKVGDRSVHGHLQ